MWRSAVLFSGFGFRAPICRLGGWACFCLVRAATLFACFLAQLAELGAQLGELLVLRGAEITHALIAVCSLPLDVRPGRITFRLRASSALIYLAAMCSSNDSDRQGVIDNFIDDPVVACTQSPRDVFTHELSSTLWARLNRERFDRIQNTRTHVSWKLSNLPGRCRGELNRVAQAPLSRRRSARPIRVPSSADLASR